MAEPSLPETRQVEQVTDDDVERRLPESLSIVSTVTPVLLVIAISVIGRAESIQCLVGQKPEEKILNHAMQIVETTVDVVPEASTILADRVDVQESARPTLRITDDGFDRGTLDDAHDLVGPGFKAKKKSAGTQTRPGGINCHLQGTSRSLENAGQQVDVFQRDRSML